ncbi:sensor domain-containing diguanylate cyclase [Billgrantia endophytica]|uniref:diguanylate cyclase n=1 Tax=Billgrantia endophytica TaxID=2033802 RepID=A0A2N7TWV5_9GAMM|nr:sensor domain-containing diguanylate cyclase [Halomonas endophytica]PMR72664.1 hypothetical protein C1H69_20695 [Halomonas endophytica]
MQTSPWLGSDILSRLVNNVGKLFISHLWEHFPEHMFILRADGPREFVIEALNPAQPSMLGDGLSCVGRRIDQLLPAQLAKDVIAHCVRCVEEGIPVRYEETGVFLDRDGLYRHGRWQILMVPIPNSDGVMTHLFGMAKELGEQHPGHLGQEAPSQELERRVVERTAELLAANRQLTHLATHDDLTGAYNRRHMMTLADTELKRAQRYGQPLSLMMLDVDNFKTINDGVGHIAGDQALRDVAGTIMATVRDCDLVGRYGGDEFILLMPETTATGAWEMAERLRATLKHATPTTVSIGIATLASGSQTLEELIACADSLLLQAKRNGRNRIELPGNVPPGSLDFAPAGLAR